MQKSEAVEAGVSEVITMDNNEVREYLPHRYPFLLVDRVLALLPGKSIRALKNVSTNEPFFPGHFPGFPIMPGVLVLEAMAQTAAILGFKTLERKPDANSAYYFAGCDKMRLRRKVLPGDQLILEVSIHSVKRDVWKFQCQSHVENHPVCSTLIVCTHRELSS